MRFSDVPTTHWAYNVIERAAKYGWVKCMPDGTFKPHANITRAAATAIVVRAVPPPTLQVAVATMSAVALGGLIVLVTKQLQEKGR